MIETSSSLTPRCWSTCANVRADESIASASRSLLITCSWVCRVRFIESLLGPAGGRRDSQSAGPEIGIRSGASGPIAHPEQAKGAKASKKKNS